MKAKLVECTDSKVVYGVLTVKSKSVGEVQSKIYEIKKYFDEIEKYDWGITDVLECFPKDWDWEFNPCCEEESVVEI